MPANRNALIRYKTIDLCLQNKYRKWTLEDLITACSETLYEYEGNRKGVSRRTIQLDIQMMRSDKLGYNAPIVVTDKKFYTYEDTAYSIMNIPLSENDLDKLMETVEFLKQFKGFSHFRELEGMVQKLEDHVYSSKVHRNPVIDFEKNEDLKGLEYLDILYTAIVNEQVILFINRQHAPYVITKPFHHSQQVIESNENGITISLEVQHNFELEKEILGLGDGEVVIDPSRLRRSIKKRLRTAAELYN